MSLSAPLRAPGASTPQPRSGAGTGTGQVLLVEDDPAFAGWMQAVIGRQVVDLEPVCAASLDEARRWLRTLPADQWQLAIVDLNLGEEDGVELIRELVRNWPSLPVLVVTSVDSPIKALSAIRAGAQGYILKATIEAELLRVIDQVRLGGSPITPSIARLLLNEFRGLDEPPPGHGADGVPATVAEKLSAREVDVLRLLARGYANKEAASALGISPATVDTHIRRIYQKLSINSRVELHRLLA